MVGEFLTNPTLKSASNPQMKIWKTGEDDYTNKLFSIILLIKNLLQTILRKYLGGVMAYCVLPHIWLAKLNSSLTLIITPKVIRIDHADIFDFRRLWSTIVLLVLRNTACSASEQLVFGN